MNLFIACDHGGLDLKNALCEWLRQDASYKDLSVSDLGVHTSDAVDYPDQANILVEALRCAAVEQVKAFGILICGSGVGVSMVANRHHDMRAALVSEPVSAALARAHNNANIICLGGRLIGVDMAKACVRSFLSASFEGGRHERRIQKFSTAQTTL